MDRTRVRILGLTKRTRSMIVISIIVVDTRRSAVFRITFREFHTRMRHMCDSGSPIDFRTLIDNSQQFGPIGGGTKIVYPRLYRCLTSLFLAWVAVNGWHSLFCGPGRFHLYFITKL